MKREYYETPKSGPVMHFFWKAAGGDRYILDKATYADQMKYMCLGGIVIATGVMAGLAGGYAFYTIFEPRGSALDSTIDIKTSILSVFFGIIWGLIIFNIDRFIVTSTGKGDGTEAITWQEFKSAIPRIIMGAIIAITISKPVEIRMFKTEIDVALYNHQEEEKRKFIEGMEQRFAGRINAEKEKIIKWQDEIDKKEQSYTDAVNEFNKELAERPGGSSSGYGPDAKKKEATMKDRKFERDQARQKFEPFIQTSFDNIKQFEAEKQAEINKSGKIAGGLDGLLERIKLAHSIAGWMISLFITLLFMAIELTPIFFKLMLVKTPYDYLEDNVKELVKAEHGIEVQIDYYQDKEGQDRHRIIHHAADRLVHEKIKVAEAQKELTEYALGKYVMEQKAKIDLNPSAYVQTEDIKIVDKQNT